MKWCCILTTLLILQIQADSDSDDITSKWFMETFSGGNGSPMLVNPQPQQKDPAFSDPAECGWNNPDISTLQPTKPGTVNVTYASYGDFPWMVAIVKQSETTVWVPDNYIGGGSLLHPSVVVTAYHKIQHYTADKLKCRAGEWDTSTDTEHYPTQERDARKIIKHKEYYKTSGYYDIALVLLQKPFTLAGAPHMGTACVARVLPPADTTCFSMGWGKDVNDSNLKKVKLRLVEANRCQNLLRTNTRLTELFVLHKSLTCAAGEDGVDTCNTDGGSSLVCPIGQNKGKTRYAMVGILVYGLACDREDIPGAYVNMPLVNEWIDEKMTAEGYDSNSYTY